MGTISFHSKEENIARNGLLSCEARLERVTECALHKRFQSSVGIHLVTRRKKVSHRKYQSLDGLPTSRWITPAQ